MGTPVEIWDTQREKIVMVTITNNMLLHVHMVERFLHFFVIHFG